MRLKCGVDSVAQSALGTGIQVDLMLEDREPCTHGFDIRLGGQVIEPPDEMKDCGRLCTAAARKPLNRVTPPTQL